MNRIPKPHTIECRAYLEWVRTLPCVVCGVSGSHAHHVRFPGNGGTSLKSTDLDAIPLCADHHVFGQNAYHAVGRLKFENVHGLDMEKVVRELNQRFIYERVA